MYDLVFLGFLRKSIDQPLPIVAIIKPTLQTNPIDNPPDNPSDRFDLISDARPLLPF